MSLLNECVKYICFIDSSNEKVKIALRGVYVICKYSSLLFKSLKYLCIV